MVNEERLQHMIKIAKFDTYEGKRCKPMTQYERKDYVSLELLKSFVTGTIAFFLMLGLWSLYSMKGLMEKLNQLDLRGVLIILLVLYSLFLLFYLGATYVVFHIKYTKGRREVKRCYSNLKRMNRLYAQEERLRMPEGKGWE